ncbi:hypothetical protein BaRGS_00006715 [Batillaria attramentaria]|uniref:Uncharacterized protein n=1 Tax=Batillaria attramentaria TaxID=370345 RepID=A0ABD0LSB2_9CAEN
MHHPPSTQDENSEFDCLPGMVPCYRDCCHRGLQFCNDREQRCQHCNERELYCGNETLLPPACDVYCLKRDPHLCSGMPDTVHPAYFWSTCILGTLLALLLITEGGRRCSKKLSQRRQTRTMPELPDELDSSAESLLPGKNAATVTEAEEPRDITAEADGHPRETQSPTFGGSATFTPALHEPSLSPASPPAFQPGPASSLNLPPGEMLTPPPTPPASRPLTPTDEDTKVKKVVSMSAEASTQVRESPPLLGKQAPFHPTSLPCDYGDEVGENTGDQFNYDDTAIGCGKGRCHDPRLDNLIPSSDVDHIVSIHTGHSSPLHGRGVRYMTDS